VVFHTGDAEVAPGITVHACGGHSMGLQCVRVNTARGRVVLASDVTHFYENMEAGRPFTTAFHIGEMLEGFDKLRALAPSPKHVPLARATNPQAQTHHYWCAFTAGLPPASATPFVTSGGKTKSLISAATASPFLLFCSVFWVRSSPGS
jgi:glyoxylase-like metal-dependent hydrolase (beta-lactamase superfamily II)